MSLTMPMQAFTRSRLGDVEDSLSSIMDDPTQYFLASETIRPKGGVPDILSASYYPQVLMQPYTEPPPPSPPNPRKRKATTSSSQLYGGLVLAGSGSDDNHSSSAEPELSATTKKPRSSKQVKDVESVSEAGEKKQRGRPRLDTQDETAADRRRTQIRLAQRAYRNRKETTISALKKRVEGLHNTIEQMNKTFLTLHDNIIDAGILNSHYSLGRQLQSAMEEFVNLSKSAFVDSDEDEEAAIADLMKEDDLDLEGHNNKKKKPNAKQISKPASKSTNQSKNTRRKSSLDKVSDEADGVEELPLLAKEDDSMFALSQTAWAHDNSNTHGLNDLLSFNVRIPEVSLYDDPPEKLVVERPLKPAHQAQGSYTYSFQETTFARRLHRMCLERAFRNLTNPQIDPFYIKRAFRFTFCFSNRKRMLHRFQELLKRKAGESLENWNVPFFHIGGAGTHFPQRDNDGNALYPPNMISPAKALGPNIYVQPETPRTESSTQEMLDNIGFGGIWFDSHDVEEYLKSKGIFLDGSSSFVEVNPSVLAHLKMSASTSDASSGSSEESLLDDLRLRTPSPPLRADAFLDPLGHRPLDAIDLANLYNDPSALFSSTNSYHKHPATAVDTTWENVSGFASGLTTTADVLQRGQPHTNSTDIRCRGISGEDAARECLSRTCPRVQKGDH